VKTLTKVTSPDLDALRPYKAAHDHIEGHAGEYIEEVRRFLRIPGFSDTGEGIRKSAEAALDYVKLPGAAEAEIVETEGHPVVYGKLLSKNPKAKTILVYCLYDQTPVDPAEWTVPPLGGEIIDPRRLGLPAEVGSIICNRATYNHRGPMTSFLLALQTMKEIEGDIPVNVVCVWEGEEEIGSPSLPGFVERYRDKLRGCDAMYMPFMQQSWEGPMTIWRGFKGGLLLELECKGGEWGGTVDGRHTWAGHAPWVDAPMMRLIHAVGSLFDADHNIAVEGVNELITPLNAEDREQIDILRKTWTPHDDEMFKAAIAVSKFRGGKSSAELLERWVSSVSINVQGVVGGYMGPTFYTLLPQKAVAKLDVRLPPGATKEKVLELIRRHLDRRGFTEIQIGSQGGYHGHRTPTDHWIIQAGIKAAALHGVPTVLWPNSNGFCPASMFGRAPLNLPSSFHGFGHGDRPHQPDEYIQVEAIPRYMLYTVTYLHELAKA